MLHVVVTAALNYDESDVLWFQLVRYWASLLVCYVGQKAQSVYIGTRSALSDCLHMENAWQGVVAVQA